MKSTHLKRSLLAASLSLVVAQTFSMPLLPAYAAASDVNLAGQVVITNIASAGGLTGERRAEMIQQNLDNALVAASDKSPAAVGVTYVKGTPVITLGGFQVATVDGASAKAAGTTPALLAKRWGDALRNSLRDQSSVQAYVAQLSGSYQDSAPDVIPSAPARATGTITHTTQAANMNTQQVPMQQPMMQARVVYAPAGLVLPATITTAVSSEIARPGDMIQASLSQPVILGETQLPTGTVLIGQISDSTAGKMLGRSGELEIKFNRLRLVDGQEIPLTGHLVGGIDKYADSGSDRSDTFHGETWKGKVVQAGVRGLIGAGTGAALGTAVGAIAGGTRGLGRGAWSGAAIGGGVGLAQSLILRKGQNVKIASGTPIQLQLDAPIQFTVPSGQPPMAYGGNF